MPAGFFTMTICTGITTAELVTMETDNKRTESSQSTVYIGPDWHVFGRLGRIHVQLFRKCQDIVRDASHAGRRWRIFLTPDINITSTGFHSVLFYLHQLSPETWALGTRLWQTCLTLMPPPQYAISQLGLFFSFLNLSRCVPYMRHTCRKVTHVALACRV